MFLKIYIKIYLFRLREIMYTTRKEEVNQQVQILFAWLVNIFDEKEKIKYFKTKEWKMQEKMKKGTEEKQS